MTETVRGILLVSITQIFYQQTKQAIRNLDIIFLIVRKISKYLAFSFLQIEIL